jgi:peptide/nickel transport system ATP-binding protein
MLAMAVARRPKLVIADEPTTALDVSVQAQVLALFSDLRREFGCAFVLITHDLGVVAEVADRIGVMYAGRIIELGQARDVLAKPSHPYTASLLGSRFTLHSDRGRPLPAMVGEPPDARINLRTCAFSPRCAAADSACEEGIPEQDRALRHDGVAACIRQGAALSVLRDSFAEIKTHPWPATATPHGGARVTNLAVEFGNKGWFGRGHVYHALRGISLEVGAGEAVAIVGESGSGKSTLLRALAGLQKPNSGTVQLLGGPSPQMVFQDAGSSLTPWMTIGELLAERIPELTSQMRRARISESLQRVGLPPEAARLKPDQMSGGQRQRAGLARAIIDPPGLLLCDEPISALDASLATGALNLIGRLRRELGFAMVFVTHDLAAARLVADRILVMTGGEIVEEGAPDEICRRPGNPYTRMLLDAVPHLEVAAWL